ncbi:hypothetical protein Q8F55_000826 [Vanrija albida]|uniref:Cytochrome b5 heme-binding domain-containing protein n=1 Tax=Vanrija albida TaxID=181172 RepID=A0ABR3QF22_9TREE
MSWLLPSLPSIPGWSRPEPPAPSEDDSDKKVNGEEEDDEDLDVPPQFPLPNSAQRSQAPAPAFALAPPSPPKQRSASPPSDLNIAIINDPIPLGNMPLPHSTTTRPDFGIKAGGGLDVGGALKPPPPKKVKGRGKVALAPGHSALDWARLQRSGADLRGIEGTGYLRVTMEELKKHKSRDDAWSAFNGRVYNITPYLNFHPGGVDELMRVAGRDGTKLFMLTHSWVNMEHLMAECMIGMLVRG